MAKKRDLFIPPDSFDETRIKEDQEHTPTHTDTPTYTHTHKHTPEPVAKKRKDRRVQLLTFGDLVDRMDAYAQKRGVSRAEVFEVAMEKYLSEVGE